MNTYLAIAQVVAAIQHLENKDPHPVVIRCTTTDPLWGVPRTLTEIPEGRQVFGPCVQGVKDQKTGKVMEVNHTDWILFTELGNILVLPDHLFTILYKSS